MMMTCAEIRQAFLDYFQKQKHTVVPSSSLVPHDDPSLLFTNAGMVQFKDTFLGLEQRDYTRATSSQRCVRAGGKHNDLDNVGYTARHHTFFEMLGNFSFGDYSKRGAIRFAWEFLTEVLKLPKEKLWVTVYTDDDEAADIWLKEMEVDPTRFSRCGAEDNFWAMGDTGPCGPCSEIFYDHGPDVPGGPPGSENADEDRYIEIWNLVFMQYERDAKGNLTALPKPSVDTGMGLERLAAVLQGVHSNYEIDLFQDLLKAAAKLLSVDDHMHTSLRVICDHIRSTSFLIADGVLPSNEGRGYVLRRIIRRAVRHGYKLGAKDLFFHQMVAPLAKLMGDAYPELVKMQGQIERVLRKEEEQFAKTLSQGMQLLEEAIAKLKNNTLAGDVIFKLYDTYGFPADLTADIARERGFSLDLEGFDTYMDKQRAQSKAASQFTAAAAQVSATGVTTFTGYEQAETTSKVTGVYKEGQQVDKITAGAEAQLTLESSPFYGESGGQVGDTGELIAGEARFQVVDTQKQAELIVHYGKVVSGEFSADMEVVATIDETKRHATALNHSATHLMHAALRKVLGEHVAQKGSLVDSERLRFDFTHFSPVTPEELDEIELLVNEQIRANHKVLTQVMSPEEAIAQGAVALFGEKYGDKVRVLAMGDFSVELCGGTHVSRTGDIGGFKIISETGIAAGIRRIEAITGDKLCRWQQAQVKEMQHIADLLKTEVAKAPSKLEQLLQRQKDLEKTLEQVKAKAAASQGSALADQAVSVGDIKVLAAEIEGQDNKAMLATIDQLKQKLGDAVILLAAKEDGRVRLVAGASKSICKQYHAGELIKHVAGIVGGKGGGRPDMAQAGGTDPQALGEALAAVLPWIEERCHA